MEEEFKWENLVAVLQTCHRRWMAVWNKYREQIVRRGIKTEDAVHSLVQRCSERREQFTGTTVDHFCRWSSRVLNNWILDELRRHRADSFPSEFDPADSGQPRPSVAALNAQVQLTIAAARARLTDVECALFDALCDHPPKEGVVKPKPLPQRVRAYLDTHRPALRPANPEWEVNATLVAACDAAWAAFDAHARAVYDELEG
jgi:hypothetical protein